MSQVPHNDHQNTTGPLQEKGQPAVDAASAGESRPGLPEQNPQYAAPAAPGLVQAKGVPVAGADAAGDTLSGFLAQGAPVSEVDSANELLPGLRAKRVPAYSASEALPGFLASANLTRSWWRNAAPASATTSPLPRIAQPQPLRRGRDTTLIAAILAVLITLSSVFLGMTTYHRAASLPRSSGTSVASVTASTYPFSKQPPALSDPLANASHTPEYGWSGGQTCSFFADAYHALADTARPAAYCLATNRSFSDFSFQVQMTIKSGGNGGLVFRVDSTKQQFYLLSLDAQGNFALSTVQGTASQVVLRGNAGSAFHTGFNQTNLIAVTARGNQFSLYFNQLQKSAPFEYTDHNFYPVGQLGFFAGYAGSATDVAYSHVQVWAL